MRLAVFGATGGTGRLLVAQALAAGHQVTAVARRPSAVGDRHGRLEVVRGDVLDPSTIERAVAGHDAVVSALGAADRAPTTVYSEGTGNVARAMRAAGVRRLACVSSGGLETDHPHAPLPQRLVTKLLVQRLYKNVFADMARMEEELERSGLDWTVVRAPMLMDGPRTGRYRTAASGHLHRPGRISRADLADYVLAHLPDPGSYRAKVEISY
jgi:putative NADH-flavin reductase